MSELDNLHPQIRHTLRDLNEVSDEIASAWKAFFCPEPSEQALDEIAKCWCEAVRHFEAIKDHPLNRPPRSDVTPGQLPKIGTEPWL